MTGPKVSCVMITAYRLDFIQGAIRCFLAQTYPNRELVVYDTGEKAAQHLIPDDPRIRYYSKTVPATRTIGELRNTANDLAAGEFIAHWDDDDWSAPDRIMAQLAHLAVHPRAHLAGYHSMLFHDVTKVESTAWWKYGGDDDYAIGTSFFYPRSVWRAHEFAAKDIGEDNSFVEDNELLVAAQDGVDPEIMMIARTHARGTSTARQQYAGDTWTPIEDEHFILRAEACLA